MVFSIKMYLHEAFDFGRLNDAVATAQNTRESHLVALSLLVYDDSNLSLKATPALKTITWHLALGTHLVL